MKYIILGLVAVSILLSGCGSSDSSIVGNRVTLSSSYKNEWYSIPEEDREYAADCLQSKMHGSKFIVTKLESWKGRIRIWGDMYVPSPKSVMNNGQPVTTDRFLGNQPLICDFKTESDKELYKAAKAEKEAAELATREKTAMACLDDYENTHSEVDFTFVGFTNREAAIIEGIGITYLSSPRRLNTQPMKVKLICNGAQFVRLEGLKSYDIRGN